MRLFSRRPAAVDPLTTTSLPAPASYLPLRTVTRKHYLIPGSWYSEWVYAAAAQRIRAAGHRVITPTLPGHGLTHPPRPWELGTPGLTLNEIVDPLQAQIEQADEHELHAVGWSFGGIILMLLYQRMPERFRSLTWFDGFVLAEGSSLLADLMQLIPPDRSDFTTTFESLIDFSSDSIMLTRKFVAEQFMPDADDALLDHAMARLRPEPLGPLREAPDVSAFWQLMRGASAAQRSTHTSLLPPAPRITYLFAPEDDKLGIDFWFCSPNRLTAAGIALTELTLRKGGHAAMLTQPDLFADAVLAISDPAGPEALWTQQSGYTIGRPVAAPAPAPALIAAPVASGSPTTTSV